MTDNTTLPGTGDIVEDLDTFSVSAAHSKRQVVTISPRDLSAGDSIGALTETAPTTDTASSGLNGRLQRIAQRLTSLLGVFPTTIDTNSGSKSASTLRVVLATDQPALTNKLLVTPDSVALPANQSVNVAQVNGVTALMGNGVTGTGSQRVTIASDNTAFAVNPASATAPVSTMNSASASAGVTSAIAANFDDTSPTAITENNYGFLRMSANRNLYSTIRDAAGNERGVNVNASNQLAIAGPVTVVSGGIASGAIASGAIASGAVASGAFASGSIAAGAVAAGATSFVKLEDVASADADAGVPAMAVRKATPANTSGTDGDYEMLQISGGLLWTTARIDQTTVGTTDSVSVKSQGFSAAVSLTRTADTNAYAANDVLGSATGSTAALTFSSMGPSGKEILITSAALEIDASAVISGETSYRLYLYNVTPPSALGDNAAFDLPSGDRASFLGYVDLGTPVDLGSTLYVETNIINKQVLLSGTSLFGYLVTNGAYTPTSARVHKITLHSVAV